MATLPFGSFLLVVLMSGTGMWSSLTLAWPAISRNPALEWWELQVTCHQRQGGDFFLNLFGLRTVFFRMWKCPPTGVDARHLDHLWRYLFHGHLGFKPLSHWTPWLPLVRMGAQLSSKVQCLHLRLEGMWLLSYGKICSIFDGWNCDHTEVLQYVLLASVPWLSRSRGVGEQCATVPQYNLLEAESIWRYHHSAAPSLLLNVLGLAECRYMAYGGSGNGLDMLRGIRRKPASAFLRCSIKLPLRISQQGVHLLSLMN